GAGAVGLEIQAGLAGRAKQMAERLRLERVSSVHGDAEKLVGFMTTATVFFFYCPFNGERVARVMEGLRPLAQARPLRLCFVDMPAPDLPWLVADAAPQGEFERLAIRRTRLHTDLGARAAAFNAASLATLAP